MSLKEIWNNRIDFKNINQRKSIILVLAFIIVFIVFFKDKIVFTLNDYEQNKEWKKRDYKKEYYGKVIKKGKDRNNHGFLYFQFKDSTKIFDDREKVWKKISVGDSVVKKANSKFLLIYKPDKMIIVNYDDIFKYRDSLIRAGEY